MGAKTSVAESVFSFYNSADVSFSIPEDRALLVRFVDKFVINEVFSSHSLARKVE